MHPTSVVHSMVEFVDGSTLVQASPADDADPDRARAGLARPGARRRPGGRLDAGPRPGSSSRSTTRRSRRCGWPARPASRGGTAPAVYNAANEVCVEAFLDGGCRSPSIVPTVARVLGEHDVPSRDGSTVDGRPRRRRLGARPRLDTDRDRSEAAMTTLVYTLGVVLFLVGVLASIGLHKLGHMIPAKLFGVKVTQYFVGFGQTVWSQARRDRVRRQGDPARRLRQARRDAAARARTRTRRRPRRPHRYVRPAGRRRPRGGARARSRGTRGPALLQAAWWKKVIVMVGRDDQPGHRVPALRGRVHGPRHPRRHHHRRQRLAVRDRGDQGERDQAPAPARAADPVAPAKAAGIRPGDRIVSFNGTR